jgi:hypothetical protein
LLICYFWVLKVLPAFRTQVLCWLCYLQMFSCQLWLTFSVFHSVIGHAEEFKSILWMFYFVGYVFVPCLWNLCQTQGHKDFDFFLKLWKSFRFYIYISDPFWIMFWYWFEEWTGDFLFFASKSSVISKIISSLREDPLLQMTSQHVCGCTFGLFCWCVSQSNASVTLLLHHWFITSLECTQYKSSDFFFRVILAILGSLHFHMNFIKLVNFHKQSLLGFW